LILLLSVLSSYSQIENLTSNKTKTLRCNRKEEETREEEQKES